MRDIEPQNNLSATTRPMLLLAGLSASPRPAMPSTSSCSWKFVANLPRDRAKRGRCRRLPRLPPDHGHHRRQASFLNGVALPYARPRLPNIDLAERLPAVASTRTAHTAVAFLVVGICPAAAVSPHSLLPNAYTFAPSAVTALLAATASKVRWPTC